MNAPLHFYPSEAAGHSQRLLAGANGIAALALLWIALRSSGDALAWKLGYAALATGAACLGGICHRAAQRLANARRSGEPQLVVDDFGITLRGELRWRPIRIPWSRVRAMSVVPDEKGLSIMIEGKLAPFGSLVDVRIADDADADAVEAQLARFAPRLNKSY